MVRSTPRARGTARAITAAFALGLGLRAILGQALPVEPRWDGVLFERAAAQLAEGRGLTQAIYDPERRGGDLSTAFYPPGWPAVLSLVDRAGGSRRIDLLLQALLGALVIPLAARFAGAVAGHLAARRAAWLVALWPGGWLVCASWLGEPLFTLALALALAPLVGPRGARTSRGALSATLLGVAAYVRPTALVIAPLALAARAWGTPRRPRWRRIALALALAPLALLPLAPWLARNAERHGAPALTTSTGANLYVGTLGARYGRIAPALDCAPGTRELVRDACRRERALARIASEPGPWLLLGAHKTLHTFAYETTPAYLLEQALGAPAGTLRPPALALAALSSAYWLALAGLALVSRGRAGPRRVVAASVLGVAALHFAFFGGDRYHLPLVPLVAALAAAALSGRRVGARRARSRALR
ncbi:MAG: hypothetical protein KF729_17365 [Sandaracinaceae bacterium]|nr:hypothetical protein [Sandaracinaceae bacterium]